MSWQPLIKQKVCVCLCVCVGRGATPWEKANTDPVTELFGLLTFEGFGIRLVLPNCSFKFEGPFAHLPLNAVRNKGGGISEGQAREHELNMKAVFNLQRCVTWDGGRRTGSSETLHLWAVNSHTWPFATEVWYPHVWSRVRPCCVPLQSPHWVWNSPRVSDWQQNKSSPKCLA